MRNRTSAKVLSACLLALAFLTPLCALAADRLFRDSGDKYTLRVPEDWTLHAFSAGLMIKGNKIEMDLDFILSRLEPMLFMASQATGIQNSWKDLTTVEESETTIAGNKAFVHVLQGTDRGVSKLARLVCFNAGSAVYCFRSEIATSDRAEMLPIIIQVEQSFREASDKPAPALNLSAHSPALAMNSGSVKAAVVSPEPVVKTAPPQPVAPVHSAGSLYRDPKGRFQIAVPNGWDGATAGEGAVISQGNTYVNLIVVDGLSSVAGFMQTMAQQYHDQWKNFQSLQTGKWTLAGSPGEYGMYSGVNPQGVSALLRIVVASESGKGFLMLTSVPQSDWEAQKADLQRIEQGFATGNTSTVQPAATSGSASKYQRYESDNPAFGLLKPANWQVRPEATADSMLISLSNPAGTSVVQTLFADNSQRHLDAITTLGEQSRRAKTQYPDLTLSSVTACKDKSCVTATETYTRDKLPVRAKLYIQTDAQQVVVRSYRAPAASFDAERNMLLELMSNIRLGRPSATARHPDTSGGGPPPLRIQLANRRSADGSVSLNLPADWNFEAGGGKVIAGEPGVGLGFIFTSFQVMPTTYGVAVQPGVIVSPYRPPSAFILTIFQKFGNRDVRIINSTPDTQTMNECPREIRNRCEAADFTLSWVSPKGVSCVGGFKLVNATPNLAGQWFSIVSGVWAPAKDFGRYLPTLEKIAGSFSINNQYSGRYIQNGLANLRVLQQKTQQSMQDLSNSLSQNQRDWEARQASRDNSDSKWDDYNRGNSYWISEMEGGKIYRTDSSGIQDLQTGDRAEGAPYNYVHFDGENPRHPSESMHELSSYEVQQMMTAAH